MDKKKLEEKYIMMQLLDAQIRELEKEMSALETKNTELIKLKDSLDSLGKVKKGAKSYSPLGLGIYTASNITNTEKVLVNVGNNIIVEKDIANAKELVDNQLKQVEDITLKLAQNVQTLAARAHELQHEIQDLSGVEK